ncbi:MAG TPA: hypothetical protein VGC08_05195, partial [Pedobacter sp.]
PVKKKQQSYSSADHMNGKIFPVFPDSLKDTVSVKSNTADDSVASGESGLVAVNVPADKTGRLADKTEVINKTDSIISKQGRNTQSIGRTDKQKRTRIYQSAGKPFNSASVSSSKTAYVVNSLSDSQRIVLVNPVLNIGSDKSMRSLLIGDRTVDQLIINKQGKTSLNAKNSAAKASSSKNSRADRAKKVKGEKTKEIITPSYDLGLESGWNTGKSSSLYLGFFGAYRIKPRLLLNAGVRLNTAASLSGNYTTKPGSFIGDTVYRYKVSDKRKLMVLNVPLTVEYRLSNRISVNAGPVISLPLSQSNIKSGTEFLSDPVLSNKSLDTVRHRSIDSALTHVKLNRINTGITGGISIRFSQFYIEAKYLQNFNPYKITSSLGSYRQSYQSFQLGIRYKFKK